MTKEEAIALAVREIESEFPGFTRGHSFEADLVESIWHVYVPPVKAGYGGGIPCAEVRHSDQRVLEIYFER